MADGCPWKAGSKRRRFYRPDWSHSPDCHGCGECPADGTHQCHVLGLVSGCTWPKPIVMDGSVAYWRPAQEAGLAERWL